MPDTQRNLLSRVLAVATLLFTTQTLVANAQVVTYNWTVTKIDAAYFDGVSVSAYGINGLPCHEFPIEVELGQQVQVSVTNQLDDDEPTCMHWHGMKQLGTQDMDGVSDVTQCSIHPGQTAVYTFTPDKAGTFWWHSHHGEQYALGLRGPLIVHPPADEVLPWEEDVDEEFTVQLADWYHAVPTFVPIWDTVLINNRGTFNCSAIAASATSSSDVSVGDTDSSNSSQSECNPDQSLTRFRFQPGNKYRLRVLNMAGLAPFNFSIDEHDFQVIATDGENVLPSTPISHLIINAGQRYDLIVHAKNDSDAMSRSFWMRATALLGLPWTAHSWDDLPDGFNRDGLAIVDYADNATALPTSEPYCDQSATLGELDFSPVAPATLPISPDQRVVTELSMSLVNDTVLKVIGEFAINGGDARQFETPDVPPLLSIAAGLSTLDLPASANAVGIDYGKHIEVVVVNTMNEQHPIHLHSHAPWVVGAGTASREAIYGDQLSDLKLVGPVMRDVYTVPPCDTDDDGECINLGYLVLRFYADSPGVWMMHCHIDWHMADGLAMLFVEGEDELHARGVDSFSNSILSVCKG
jgi:iron transport multicopper oxidase